MGDAPQGSPPVPDDAAAHRLSAGIARGDAAALDEFYRAWFDWSYRLARRITGRDESFCLDVVQEAVLRVARTMKPMRRHADLERWMTRVVHTAALDLLRREARRVARERGRVMDAAAGSAPALSAAEQAARVRRLLAALPPEDGWLVWLRFGEGRTLRDAGLVAGVGEQAAHGRIRRALARLRVAAKEVGDER